MEIKTPKAFISYSWTSPGHQAAVKEWAERLVNDGVDVVLDLYELKEGQDKFVYMERMVSDKTVTHVLVLSDRIYAEKANARKAGVGTESQIMSKEIYESEQTKFIPIVCELDEAGEPCLPTFMSPRIWIDFSTSEAVNENWEQLIRLLFDKPLHVKPQLGKPPAYILEDVSIPASPALAKFATFKQALLQGKPAISRYRRDFLDACIAYADALRVRERPEVALVGEKVLADCGQLKSVRNHITDWLLLEAETNASDEFTTAVIEFLERLGELKARPAELNSWQDGWFEAHELFVFETFLYLVAALIKAGAYETLHQVLTTRYLVPGTEHYRNERFESFRCFYGRSDCLQILAPEGKKLHSPAAALIKQQADREDLSFEDLKQADMMVFLMALVPPNGWWFPQLQYYADSSQAYPIFLRATQARHFRNLAVITGINNGDDLREAVAAGMTRLKVNTWHDFWGSAERQFQRALNLENLDTLK
jgi:hypothetical protein